jgi:tripartite-type tricarboxylate transporter receptor subunit TctC
MQALRVAVALAVGLVSVLSAPVRAADPAVSFAGKTVTMIIPSTPGGSTDLSARLVARFLGKHLPGQPAVVASNVPGGHGVGALNFLAQQAKPDGLTVTISGNSQVDPITYRTPQAHYDPQAFTIVGATGVGDNVMIIRTDALPRLYDKSQKPVAMGSVPGQPRSGMQMNLWGTKYLGWNTRWVVGYPGSTDLVLALERGEIDMTSFPRAYVIDKLNDPKKFTVLYLDGLDKDAPKSGRADADSAPYFTDAMAGKVKDPKMQAAFNYWLASKVFKWVALPPKTPAAISAAYRKAFDDLIKDPEFDKQAKNTLESFYVISPEKAEEMIRTLAATSDEAIKTTEALMREQGLKIGREKEDKDEKDDKS